MSNISKISVTVTAEMNDLIQAAVASGEYATGSEVLREALQDWKRRRTVRQHDHAELRRLWAEGIESGPGRLGGMDEIKREARSRLDALPSSAD